MTTITIPIDVAEAAAEALGNFVSDHGWTDSDMQAMDNLDAYIARHKANQAARDKLAKPADIADEMSAVADQFAHRLALDLECVLADYQGTWYDTAINTLGAYRGAMNAIHERESPTFMGEPVLLDIAVPTPAWHDAPEVATLKAERDRYRKALEAMTRKEPCDCGCPSGEKAVTLKPAHYYAIAAEALKGEVCQDGRE